MKPGKTSTRQRARRLCEREILELQKVRHLIFDLQQSVRHRKEYHPELYSILELDRVWEDLRDIGTHTDCAGEYARRVCDLLRDGFRPAYDISAGSVFNHGQGALSTVAEEEADYSAES